MKIPKFVVWILAVNDITIGCKKCYHFDKPRFSYGAQHEHGLFLSNERILRAIYSRKFLRECVNTLCLNTTTLTIFAECANRKVTIDSPYNTQAKQFHYLGRGDSIKNMRNSRLRRIMLWRWTKMSEGPIHLLGCLHYRP